jgi:hypothetical protein
MASTEQAKELVKVGDIQNSTLTLPRRSLFPAFPSRKSGALGIIMNINLLDRQR